MAQGGGGGGASAGAIKAGGAFVELFTDSTQLERGLKQAERQVHAFGTMMTGAGLKVAGAGAAILTPLAFIGKTFLERGEKFAHASARLGESAENLSLLDYAARQSGTSLDQLEGPILKMQQNIAEAADKGGELADMLAEVGLSAAELTTKGATEQLFALADALAKVENQGQKIRLARGIAGRTAPELFPVIGGGQRGLRDLMAEGERAGAKVTTEEARAAEKVGQSLTRVWEAGKNAVLATLTVLVPTADAIESLSQQVVDLLIPVREWIAENKALVLILGAVGVGLVAGGAALIALGFAATAAEAGMSAVGVAFGIVGGAIELLLSPVGLVALAIAGVALLIINFSEDAQGAIGQVLVYFEGMAETFKTAWQGINAALAKGDLKLAFSIAVAGLNVEWTKLIVQMTKAWNSFKNLVVDTWHLAIAEVAKGMIDILAKIRDQAPMAFRAVFGHELANMNPDEAKRAIDLDEKFRQLNANRERKADLEKAQADAAAAKAELDRLVGQANAEREVAPMPRAVADEIATARATASRGTFATRGFGAQVFGTDRMATRQVKAAENAVALLTEVRDELKRAGPLVLST